MADPPTSAYKWIKEAITIGYSDVKFYWNALHGEAYRYWWEIMTRTPYGVYNARVSGGTIGLRS
jgi:hypothetical protein